MKIELYTEEHFSEIQNKYPSAELIKVDDEENFESQKLSEFAGDDIDYILVTKGKDVDELGFSIIVDKLTVCCFYTFYDRRSDTVILITTHS